MQWYKKLKDSGFNDIENPRFDGSRSESWPNINIRPTVSYLSFVTNQEYFIQASRLLETYKFKNKTHKMIWILHCDGLSVREIAEKLGTCSKSWVHELIKLTAKEIKS